MQGKDMGAASLATTNSSSVPPCQCVGGGGAPGGCGTTAVMWAVMHLSNPTSIQVPPNREGATCYRCHLLPVWPWGSWYTGGKPLLHDPHDNSRLRACGGGMHARPWLAIVAYRHDAIMWLI